MALATSSFALANSIRSLRVQEYQHSNILKSYEMCKSVALNDGIRFLEHLAVTPTFTCTCMCSCVVVVSQLLTLHC